MSQALLDREFRILHRKDVTFGLQKREWYPITSLLSSEIFFEGRESATESVYITLNFRVPELEVISIFAIM